MMALAGTMARASAAGRGASGLFVGLVAVGAVGLVTACGDPSTGEGLRVPAASSNCGTCHPDQYAQWAASPLATGTSSPVFAALVERVEADWGADAAARCRECHAPGLGGGDPERDPGVGCVACHGAVGNHGTRDGRLAIELGVPLAGPSGSAAANQAHGVRESGFLRDPSLCGTCHEVTGPNLLVETTHSEYVASGDARTCVDCHMPALEPGLTAVSSTRPRPRVDHRFIGFDPSWSDDPDEVAERTDATRALLASALTLRASSTSDGWRVTVRNVGAAHNVPTGVSMLRDIWVDARLYDDAGSLLATRPRVLELGARMLDGDDEVALLTHADRVVDDSLAAGAATDAELEAPAAAALELTLRARAFKPSVLEALELSHLAERVPVHELHTLRVEHGEGALANDAD